MKARIKVTMSAEIDSPCFPGDHPATPENVGGMINQYLLVEILDDICDHIFEMGALPLSALSEEDPDQAGMAGLQQAKLRILRAQALLAKLFVQNMVIEVSHT